MNKKMNKTIAAALVAVGVAATAPADVKECKTLADTKAYAAQLMTVAATNYSAVANDMGKVIGALRARYERANAADKAEVKSVCAELDAAIAAIPGAALRFGNNWRYSTMADDPFAVIDGQSLDASAEAKARPVLVALARKYGVDANNYRILGRMTLDECVDLLNETVAAADGKVFAYSNYNEVKRIAGRVQSLCQRKARAYLRKQGKSFVAKDGVNPCAEVMTELNAALNAPRMKGLNEWFEKTGATDSRLDVSKLPTEKEVAQLKEAVLCGERDMDKQVEAVLKFCLGVDGYNAFVKEYNGEE